MVRRVVCLYWMTPAAKGGRISIQDVGIRERRRDLSLCWRKPVKESGANRCHASPAQEHNAIIYGGD